jgi:hypothetical protein
MIAGRGGMVLAAASAACGLLLATLAPASAHPVRRPTHHARGRHAQRAHHTGAARRPRSALIRTDPSVPESAARTQLAGLIDNVAGATAVAFDDHDSTGLGMYALKVIPASKPGTYLGVYHVALSGGGYAVRVATSKDLLHWSNPTTLALDASQPTIAALPDGGYLVAFEKVPLLQPNVSQIVLRAYASQQLLLLGVPLAQYTIPNTLSDLHEGTPSLDQVSFPGGGGLLGLPLTDLGSSTITLGLHYYDPALRADRDAIGTLQGFSSWSAAPDATLNGALSGIGGDIGGRDVVDFLGWPFTIIEAQARLTDFSSWRVYLHDDTDGTLVPLTPTTPGGSSAFGNPKLTVVTDPHGQRALAVSLIVFTQGAGTQASGATEAGPLVYYAEF